MNLPTLKENPILVAVITVIAILAIGAGMFIAGYLTCRGQAAANNLEILVDDQKAEKVIEEYRNSALLETYNNAEVLNSYEENECAKCLNAPYSADYFTIMQRERYNTGTE